MKRKRILIGILIASLLCNLILSCYNFYVSRSFSDLHKVWSLAVNNASFLYQQYDDENIKEAYDYAAGEIATINNTITFIHFGGQNSLTDSQKGELSLFYQNLVNNSDTMKPHISEIRNIVWLLQLEDRSAFIKMKELRLNIEPKA